MIAISKALLPPHDNICYIMCRPVGNATAHICPPQLIASRTPTCLQGAEGWGLFILPLWLRAHLTSDVLTPHDRP